jgi:hypothetical protein
MAPAQEAVPTPPIAKPAGTAADVDYLGPWLERKFQSMVQSCVPAVSGLKMTKVKKDKEYDVTAVPSQLRNNLGLGNGGTRIAEQEGRSVRLLFAHVFTPAEELAFKIDNGQNYLSNVEEGVPEFLSVPDVNGAAFNHTCASAMSSALEVNAGYTIPVATLKGGFQGDYDQSNSHSLTLVAGTFISPILAGYNQDPGATQRPFHAAMTIFGWYQKHKDRIEAQNRLLAEMRGTAVYQQVGLKRQTSLGASAEFKAGLLSFISGSGSASAKASGVSDFKAQIFSVAVDASPQGKPVAVFRDLPKLADVVIKAQEHGAVERASNREDLTLYNRSAHTIAYVINHLPKNLCEAPWKVEQAATTTMRATIARAGVPVSGIDSAGWPNCTIAALVTPMTDLPTNTSQFLDLKFTLAMSGDPKHSVSLTADRLTFPAFDRPHLTPLTLARRPTVASKLSTSGGVTSNLEWLLQYQLQDRADERAAVQVDPEAITIACTGTASPTLPARTAVLREGSQGTKTVEVRFSTPWSGDYDPTSNVAFVPCKVSGHMKYILKSGQSVERDFPETSLEIPLAAAPAPKP